MTFFQLLMFIITPVEHTPHIPICDMSREHLTVEQQLDIATGCSTINGMNAYSNEKLQKIYYGLR